MRTVQTVDAAMNASKSEGAVFLIYSSGDVKLVRKLILYMRTLRYPLLSCVLRMRKMSYAEASSLLTSTSGASGFAACLMIIPAQTILY